MIKKIFIISTFLLLSSGCNQQFNKDEISFDKNDKDNNVFTKNEVECVFSPTQMIVGKPNYTGTNPQYDSNELKESFYIENYQNSKNEPIKIKFLGLNSNTPQIEGPTRNGDLVSLNDNQFEMLSKIFLEKGSSQDASVSTYNISKNGSAIWITTDESVEPVAYISVGYCE